MCPHDAPWPTRSLKLGRCGRSVTLLLAALCLSHPILAEAKSELEVQAARMKAGEWAEFKTNGFEKDLLATRGSFITNFSDDAAWNPRTQELYFLGAGRGNQPSGEQTRFIKYIAADNSWSVIKLPSALYEIAHGYDHNAIDPATGAFYHRVYHTRQVHKYDPALRSWSVLPEWPSEYRIAITGGLEYFPELGGLVYISGSGEGDRGYALLFKDGKWSELAVRLSFGDYHTFSEYNPVHKVVVFGGGEWFQQGESREMYKVDAAGKVSRLKSAPLDLGTNESIFTMDPASGKYLVVGKDSSFWEYDVKLDEWRKLTSSPPVTVEGTMATPIANHGVVIFVSYHESKIYLYKHR